MTRKIIISILASAILLEGCAGYRPIVDMQGRDQANYESDVTQCQQYAEQVAPENEALWGAILGAALGAGFGALTGSYFGDAGYGAGVGASSGALYGGVAGTANAASDQRAIIQRCMAGRGWNVLR